ncbi:MAG: diguanylate cyclase [Acidimicrobiia bacterium]
MTVRGGSPEPVSNAGASHLALAAAQGAPPPAAAPAPVERPHSQEAYFEDLVESAPDAIVVVDRHGTIELVNRQAELLFGYLRSELLGQPVEVLVPDRARAAHPSHRSFYFRDPRTRPMGAGLDLTLRRKDGTEVPVDISLSPLETDRGRVVSVAIRDVTERKRAAQALQDAYARLTASVHELEQHDREMTLVNEMGDLLQSCLTHEEAHQVISRYGRRLFPNDSGMVLTASATPGVFETAATWGASVEGAVVLVREECWALRRARVYAVEGADEAPTCSHVLQPPERGYVCVPMMAQGEAFGLLHLLLGAPGDDGRAKSLDSVRTLAMTVAEQLSLALANLNLRETLRHQSLSDPLTGLYNRRYMEDQLDREIRRATRTGQSVGIVIVDVDNFKSVNDKLGHGAGDDVLRSIALTLKANVRGVDTVCRLGGDEFLIVLPDSSRAVATEEAEHVRQVVRRLDHRLQRAEAPTTLSIGVAVFPEDGSTPAELIRAADEAMYQAKAAGRDTVVSVRR